MYVISLMLRTQWSGTLFGSSCVCSGSTVGLYSTGCSVLQMSLGAITGCGTGIISTLSGAGFINSGVVVGNTLGLTAVDSSYILATSTTFIGNGTDASPVLNTIGNNNSIISG